MKSVSAIVGAFFMPSTKHITRYQGLEQDPGRQPGDYVTIYVYIMGHPDNWLEIDKYFPEPTFTEAEIAEFQGKLQDFIEFVAFVLKHPGVDLLPENWVVTPTDHTFQPDLSDS